MIKISDAVRGILYSSEVALSAFRGGYLNLSAYAKTIQKETEARAKKPVRIGSIVVALSRLGRTLGERNDSLLPRVIADTISVKSGLVELAFAKTRENRERLAGLYKNRQFQSAEFFTVTQGINEISIIVSEAFRSQVLAIYKHQKPKLSLDRLVAITVCFSERYIEVPNITFAIVRVLALQRINIVEIVSTFTELTFILRQNDLPRAFALLHDFFGNPRR